MYTVYVKYVKRFHMGDPRCPQYTLWIPDEHSIEKWNDTIVHNMI